MSKVYHSKQDVKIKSKDIADLRQKLLFDCQKAKFVLDEDLQERLKKARFEINSILDEQQKRTVTK
jgi:hypothetical protein